MAMDILIPKAAVKSRALEKAALKGMRPPADKEGGKPWQTSIKEKDLCAVKVDHISTSN
jgi:hypothetical protein